MGISCGKLLWENLAENFCRKILWGNLGEIVRENLAGKTWENFVGNSYG